MAVTLTIQKIPIGSQLVSAIGTDDPETKNDFRVLILLDANGTGLTESGITFSTGASLVSLTGSKSVWEAIIRPPVTAGTLTITVAANAFTEGNAETSKDIRVSTSFPDADAEFFTQAFTHSISPVSGITVLPNHIVILGNGNFNVLSHDGTSVRADSASGFSIRSGTPIDFINGDYLVQRQNANVIRIRASDTTLTRTYIFPNLQTNADVGIIHTRLGVIRSDNATNEYVLQPYNSQGITDSVVISSTLTVDRDDRIAHQNDLIYHIGRDRKYLRKFNDSDAVETVRRLNIENISLDDVALYRDTLYILTSTDVQTLDIRPYRPTALNTKTTIYPVFANEGETIPLKQYCPDAHTITFRHRL